MKVIGKNAKIQVHWNVSPYDFSQDKLKDLQNKFAVKYGIKRDQVKILPEFKTLSDDGKSLSITHDIINNIQDPIFQLTLFKEFLDENKVVNCDFEYIKKIDAEINTHINYDVYDKYKQYSIKWVKWDNFLSYGKDNFFDFSNLHGLVLLNGEPANQSGKTTFAIDLIHFLLFGRTKKAATQDKIFNKHISDATECVVEGCIVVDGQEYVIKRKLTRPSINKRTNRSKTTQKVEYYRIVGNDLEELTEFVENCQEENSVKTNKAIKEVIGNEDDFDLIICATSANLDDLIEKKETDRGRLLNRWIGLLPIEEKSKIAKEHFNNNIKRYFKSNLYNSADLNEEISAIQIRNQTLQNNIDKYDIEIKSLEKEFNSLEEMKTILIEQKAQVDADLLQIDICTLQNKINACVEKGKRKSKEKQEAEEELLKLNNVDFSINQYNDLIKEKTDLVCKLNECRSIYRQNDVQIKSLKSGEYCPTCGRKYDNIDYSSQINKLQNDNNKIIEQANLLNKQIDDIENEIKRLSIDAENFKIKSKLEALISSLNVSITNLRLEYKELDNKLVEYNKNKSIIDKNNELDIKIRQIQSQILNNRNTRDTNNAFINDFKSEININNQKINERNLLIQEINKEQFIELNWRIYLDMVGKDGISKMVLRKTLPIINAQISRLLNGVCDFDVVIEITDKNDVNFYLIKDGVKSDLTSGSGFERTAAALAIRAVLGNISTLPRSNIFVVDEILGRVAKENYDNMKTLYEKILENYDCIIQISHLEDIKDWHQTIVTVTKEGNISKIEVNKNMNKII